MNLLKTDQILNIINMSKIPLQLFVRDNYLYIIDPFELEHKEDTSSLVPVKDIAWREKGKLSPAEELEYLSWLDDFVRRVKHENFYLKPLHMVQEYSLWIILCLIFVIFFVLKRNKDKDRQLHLLGNELNLEK